MVGRNHTVNAVPMRYVTAYATGMLFTSAVFSAPEISRLLIASAAVPMTVDFVKAPARRPAAVPMSYSRSLDAAKALSRQLTHRTTVTASCGSASFFRPRKNWGPTLYPVVNKNRSKKTSFTMAGTLMSSCPMTTPASSVPTTVPRLNEPIRNRPTKKPTASVRKIASSWCSRRAATKYSTADPSGLRRALRGLEGVPIAARHRSNPAPDVVVHVVSQIRQRHAERPVGRIWRSEEHTSELQSHHDLVCRLLLEKKKNNTTRIPFPQRKTISKKT